MGCCVRRRTRGRLCHSLGGTPALSSGWRRLHCRSWSSILLGLAWGALPHPPTVHILRRRFQRGFWGGTEAFRQGRGRPSLPLCFSGMRPWMKIQACAWRTTSGS